MSYDSEIKRLKENLRKLNSEISAANRKSGKCHNIKVLNDEFKRLSDVLLNMNKKVYRCQKETMKLK